MPLLQIQTYFYPRPPRGGRHNPPGQGLQLLEISIHALREEGDQPRQRYQPRAVHISIHALREEGDPVTNRPTYHRGKFLSTPSARRATSGHSLGRSCWGDFYPRPPRGGRHCPALRRANSTQYFYPRPPRGGRRVQRASSAHKHNFYPRPPRGGRLMFLDEFDHIIKISIHALREEGDPTARPW